MRWIDLVAPTAQELAQALPAGVDPWVVDVIGTPAGAAAVRPTLEPHGSYVYGHLVTPVVVEGEQLEFEELGLVATPDLIVTVSHPTGTQPPGARSPLHAVEHRATDIGHALHLLFEQIAGDFLSATDGLFERIDKAEDLANTGSADDVPARLSSIRHDVIHLRRHVSGLRNAIRRIVDGRTDVAAETLFPPDLERLFAGTSDALQRTAEELDIARELLAGLRDHHQANVMEAQNEVVKKLTVIASLVLVPSLVTGFFGQNFEPDFASGWWRLWVAIALIIAATVAQLAVFRWRRWI